MKCKYCGNQIFDGASFCTNCGKKIDTPMADESKFVPTDSNGIIVLCRYCGQKYYIDSNKPILNCLLCGAELPKPKTEIDFQVEKQKILQEAEEKINEAERKYKVAEQKIKEVERREKERIEKEQLERKQEEEKRTAELKLQKQKNKSKRIRLIIELPGINCEFVV